MNGTNGVSFKKGDFLALRCKTPEAFLIVQATEDSPDPIMLRQQPQMINTITIKFRWYKRSLSYENGSDLYTPGREDGTLYKFIICTVNMKPAAQSDYIMEPAERFSILRTLKENLLQDESIVENGITPTSDEEHTILGMVPLGVVARTVLNDTTFYLVIWKGLGDRYTWESKKFIDENCDGPLSFNDSSSRIISFNLGQQPQPPPPAQPVPNPGQMPQRFPHQPPMQPPRPIMKQQLPPYQPPPMQQVPHLVPPQNKLTPPDPKKFKQEP